MAGVNQCAFIGNLGRDPEFKVTPTTQTEICEFSIGVTTKRGQEEHTEWVRCKAFNRLAEICNQYLKKGKQVYVRGRMQTRGWEQDGVKRYMTEILVDEMQMLGGRGNDYAENQNPGPAQSAASNSGPEDDIPF